METFQCISYKHSVINFHRQTTLFNFQHLVLADWKTVLTEKVDEHFRGNSDRKFVSNYFTGNGNPKISSIFQMYYYLINCREEQSREKVASIKQVEHHREGVPYRGCSKSNAMIWREVQIFECHVGPCSTVGKNA